MDTWQIVPYLSKTEQYRNNLIRGYIFIVGTIGEEVISPPNKGIVVRYLVDVRGEQVRLKGRKVADLKVPQRFAD